jgi:hypothetical protein
MKFLGKINKKNIWLRVNRTGCPFCRTSSVNTDNRSNKGKWKGLHRCTLCKTYWYVSLEENKIYYWGSDFANAYIHEDHDPTIFIDVTEMMR